MARSHMKPLISLLALGMLACNIEVGNPEDTSPGGVGMIRSISLNLLLPNPCQATTGDCAAVPFIVSDAKSSSLNYELTSVRLGLGGVTLKPYDRETVVVAADLLHEATITLANRYPSGQTSGLIIDFAAMPASLQFAGSLVGLYEGQNINVPLAVTYREAFSGETSLLASDGDLTKVSFDSSNWFDLTALPESTRLLKSISSGVCADVSSPPCMKISEAFGAHIAKRVAGSMAARTVKSPGRK